MAGPVEWPRADEHPGSPLHGVVNKGGDLPHRGRVDEWPALRRREHPVTDFERPHASGEPIRERFN